MYLLNARDRQMSNAELKTALGIDSKKHWPRAGLDIAVIDGTKVYVLPAAREPRRKGAAKHRAYAICNDCRRHIPAGRLHQHRAIHRPLNPAGVNRRIYSVEVATLGPLGSPIRLTAVVCAGGRDAAKAIARGCWQRKGSWVAVEPKWIAAFESKRYRRIPESRQ